MASGMESSHRGFAGIVEVLSARGSAGPPGGGVDGFARAAAAGDVDPPADAPVPRLGRLSVRLEVEAGVGGSRAGRRPPPRRRRRARPPRLRRSLRRRRGPGARGSRRARQRRPADFQTRPGAAGGTSGSPARVPSARHRAGCWARRVVPGALAARLGTKLAIEVLPRPATALAPWCRSTTTRGPRSRRWRGAAQRLGRRLVRRSLWAEPSPVGQGVMHKADDPP